MAPDPRDPLELVGRTLAHFRVVEPLGAGGMGIVYRAEDTRLNRVVALKLPLPTYELDSSAKQRFLHEARSAAGLDHPNLCPIYEVGESEEGHPFLAMPLYPGESVKERLARDGPLPLGDAIAIARQVAEGLAAAHDAGIVHRDVKPGNVMLLPNGGVKVLDFGLAKVRDLTLTRSGAQLGTVIYMAPEQVCGEPVDGRTDLWALGVTLYEMLTGRRPFDGSHDVLVAHAIMHAEPVRPSALRAEISRALDALLFSLLQKQPANRPVSANDVAAELRAMEPSPSMSSGRGTRWRWLGTGGWQSRRTRRTVAGVMASAVLVLAAGIVLARKPADDSVARTVPTDRSVAVLPFANLSGDSQQDYLSDGITEELTTHLSRLAGLRVVARTSSFQFKGRNADVRDVGKALGVGAVVDGSVRKGGSRVRITAQLVDASTGFQLWSETYDRELSDIFAVQDEISRAIVSALAVRLTRPVTARLPSTRSAEAYELYLKGRYFWNQRTEASLVRATEYFQQAVALDPNYAEAHSGLADVEIAPRAGLPAARFARARVAASRALVLDSLLPEAHLSLGWIAMWYDRDWPVAERHLRRAIELNPSYSWASAWYGAYLAATGRLEASLPVVLDSHKLDPLSFIHATYVGIHYLWLRRNAEAVSYFEKSLELNPDFYMAHWGLGRSYLDQGRYKEALAEFEFEGGDFTGLHRLGLLGYAHAVAGNGMEARRILDDLEKQASSGSYVPPVDLAIIYIGLGDQEQALDWLERLVADRGARTFLFDPIFDPVRQHDRFQRLLGRLGLTL